MTSYREHRGFDAERGWAVNVREDRSERHIVLELGEWRPVGAFSADAWTYLTPEQARELARELFRAADVMESSRR